MSWIFFPEEFQKFHLANLATQKKKSLPTLQASVYGIWACDIVSVPTKMAIEQGNSEMVDKINIGEKKLVEESNTVKSRYSPLCRQVGSSQNLSW